MCQARIREVIVVPNTSQARYLECSHQPNQSYRYDEHGPHPVFSILAFCVALDFPALGMHRHVARTTNLNRAFELGARRATYHHPKTELHRTYVQKKRLKIGTYSPIVDVNGEEMRMFIELQIFVKGDQC